MPPVTASHGTPDLPGATSSNPAKVPAPAQAKAIFGGLLAGLTALGTALADERVTSGEWVGVAVAALGTYATVFGVRNR